MTRTETVPDASDIVIVGGGVVGTSITYFLSERTDDNITLLEKNQIGSGSTGDSSAILRHHYGPNDMYSRMAWWSHEFYRSFEEETGQPIAYASSPMVRFGEENTVGGEYALNGYHTLKANDIPATRYSKTEIPDAFPMLTISDADFAISDDTAGYSDGTDVAGGFSRAAQDNGADIITGVNVEDLDVQGNDVVVRTAENEIRCDNVVVAAGPWTPQLTETIGVDVPVTPEREQILILDPPEAFAEEHPELTPTTAPPGGTWYMRPDFGDHVLVATHHRGRQADPDGYKNTPDEEVILELLDEMEDIIPDLIQSDIVGQYCGIYSTTPDHDFIIDEIMDNCYVACGFSGHGFKHAPVIGRGICEYIVDGGTDLFDLEYFSLDRFDGAPDGHGLPEDNA